MRCCHWSCLVQSASYWPVRHSSWVMHCLKLCLWLIKQIFKLILSLIQWNFLTHDVDNIRVLVLFKNNSRVNLRKICAFIQIVAFLINRNNLLRHLRHLLMALKVKLLANFLSYICFLNLRYYHNFFFRGFFISL